MNRPLPTEYATFHSTYIDKIGEGDIIDILEQQQESTYQLFKSVPPEKADYAYAEDKWTLKQVLGHMIDTERIMAYRTLRFSRGDSKELQGFEQEDYIRNARFNEFDLMAMAEEFRLLRKVNLLFFKSLNAEEKQRGGVASGYVVSVNALLYIIAGHEKHHVGIVKERYL